MVEEEAVEAKQMQCKGDSSSTGKGGKDGGGGNGRGNSNSGGKSNGRGDSYGGEVQAEVVAAIAYVNGNVVDVRMVQGIRH
jgi:hypothetical protein